MHTCEETFMRTVLDTGSKIIKPDTTLVQAERAKTAMVMDDESYFPLKDDSINETKMSI